MNPHKLILAKFYGGAKDGLRKRVWWTQERIGFRDGSEYLRYGADRDPFTGKILAYIYRPIEEVGRYYK
jgi:hypothetical protein